MIRLTIARNSAEAAFSATKKALEAAKKTLLEAEKAHNQAKAVYLALLDAEKEINNNIYVETGHEVEVDPNFIFFNSKQKDTGISQEVKLNKAENAWKPRVKDNKKDDDPKETEIKELKRKCLAILNKLAPQKFKTLVLKFQDLPIDSPEKLSLCMELVFEKAVDEPSFSVAYAQMCGELQKKKVTDEKNVEVNFRKLLISRCQQEFERDYMTDIDRDKYTADMEAATDPDDKKRIQMEYEAMEMKARKRSLGNIR